MEDRKCSSFWGKQRFKLGWPRPTRITSWARELPHTSKSSVQGKQQQETVAQQQQELFVRRLSVSSWTKAARGSDREAVFGGEDCAA